MSLMVDFQVAVKQRTSLTAQLVASNGKLQWCNCDFDGLWQGFNTKKMIEN